MTRRDVIAEIEGKRKRSRGNDYRFATSERLLSIRQEFTDGQEKGREVRKYVPIGIAACIEGYSRGAIRELCDFSPEYLDKALNIKSIQLDKSFISAIQNRRVTGGEIVSHLLPISSIEQIVSHFKEILGLDLWGEIRKFTPKQGDILENPSSKAMQVLKEIYDKRHVFAHEIGADAEVSDEFIINSLYYAGEFLSVIGNLIDLKTDAATSHTQSDINQHAYEGLSKSQKDLSVAIIVIERYLSDNKSVLNKFQDLQAIWEDFTEIDAEFQADYYAEGGTMWPAIYASAKENHFKQRLQNIQWLKELAQGSEST
ncbi:lysozyme inhibitor LprI family protein [Deinococcus taklimakanensis]|uniref:Lysozyme inhibitor LprI family protein n=1 Tax=Deinococcus taklimakanensis TaxID=536443 RepID=A0ABW5NZN3_9DEIO